MAPTSDNTPPEQGRKASGLPPVEDRAEQEQEGQPFPFLRCHIAGQVCVPLSEAENRLTTLTQSLTAAQQENLAVTAERDRLRSALRHKGILSLMDKSNRYATALREIEGACPSMLPDELRAIARTALENKA